MRFRTTRLAHGSTRRPRIFAAALIACTAAAAASAAFALADDYSFISTGIYSGTATIAPRYGSDVTFRGASYRFSFRLTSSTRTGIRTIRNMAIGPLPSVCDKPSTRAGVEDTYLVHTLPRQTNFAPSRTNGFIVGSYVQSRGRWRHLTQETYTGTLPHLDFSFVYNRRPPRFDPNPRSQPSVTVTYRVDDSGKISRSGKFVCTSGSVVTAKYQG